MEEDFDEMFEPSILDFNMFRVYEGDLVKEISTGDIWRVEQIGDTFIIAVRGRTSTYMSRTQFLWAATPKPDHHFEYSPTLEERVEEMLELPW